ncbi:DeoR/GlpR family DNA-binding transcription regulator [Micromonospora sp. DT233]|uniref:DeoR/GlpR family DNA-binding transcription regulator n=1 Tax=Micromonospora sp. DT233 TaxID=3393432 RepID=UPI003CE91FA8
MLARQRQSAIVELIRSRGGARVSDLAGRFGVSDMTIRRDLAALAERGLVEKVHGGATPPDSTSVSFGEPGPPARPGPATPADRQAEKRAIAARAVALVEPGMAVALSAGTTTAALAVLLADVRGLTVVTNSIPVADALHRHPRADRTVVLTGGVRIPPDALTGPIAEATAATLNVDLLFLGVHGMSPRAGFTAADLPEAGINRRLVRAASRLVVLADHTKWGSVGVATVAPLADADVLVTDAGLPEPARAHLAGQVGHLAVAPLTAPGR